MLTFSDEKHPTRSLNGERVESLVVSIFLSISCLNISQISRDQNLSLLDRFPEPRTMSDN